MELASGIAGAAAVAGLLFSTKGFLESNNKTLVTIAKSYEQIQNLQQQIAEINKENGRLSTVLNSITFSKTNQTSADVSAQIAALVQKPKLLESGWMIWMMQSWRIRPKLFQSLYHVVIWTLLKLNTKRQRFVGKKIDRIYDQNKWFIGLSVFRCQLD